MFELFLVFTIINCVSMNKFVYDSCCSHLRMSVKWEEILGNRVYLYTTLVGIDRQFSRIIEPT